MALFKDYALEATDPTNVAGTRTPVYLDTLPPVDRLSDAEYSRYQARKVQACHDVYVDVDGALLLVQRDNHPAKGELWPLGGAITKDIDTDVSLTKVVKRESGLDLVRESIQFLRVGRPRFRTESQWSSPEHYHGRGTDAIGLIFYAKGEGEVKLDNLHMRPTFVRRTDYTPEFRNGLHQYVQDGMDLAIKHV